MRTYCRGSRTVSCTSTLCEIRNLRVCGKYNIYQRAILFVDLCTSNECNQIHTLIRYSADRIYKYQNDNNILYYFIYLDVVYNDIISHHFIFVSSKKHFI